MVPAASQQPGTTFTVCDRYRTGYRNEIDLGREGSSAGDQFLEIDMLRRPQSGRKVGRLVWKATFVRVRKRLNIVFIVDFTASLHNGKVTAYGAGRAAKFGPGLKVAITGGTESYNDARGAVLLRNGQCGGKPGLHFTFNLA
jgi:hypothetical protein